MIICFDLNKCPRMQIFCDFFISFKSKASLFGYWRETDLARLRVRAGFVILAVSNRPSNLLESTLILFSKCNASCQLQMDTKWTFTNLILMISQILIFGI